MNKTTEALKLAEEALGRSQLYIDEYHPEWVQVRQENEGALAAIRESLAEPVKQEPIAWEATSAGVIKFVTDSRYKKFSQNIQQYYKPYRCSHCSEPVKQEPVAYMVKAHDSVQRFAVRADVADEFACKWRETDPDADFYPLYAAPVQPVKQEPVFWYRPINDEIYEGSVHNDSVCGKMWRDEKPGEWLPLYAAPQKAEWVELTEEELADALGWELGDPLYMTAIGLGQEAIIAFKAKQGENK